MRTILPQIVSYLIIKKAQAQKLMEFFQFIDDNPLASLKEVPPDYYERLDAIFMEIKRLNKKGKEPNKLQ